MRRKITSVSKLVNQLVDPKPEYVSLVGHGANQTPFNVVKNEVSDFRGVDNVNERGQKDKDSISKAQITHEVAMPNQAEVHKVVFDKTRFSDAEAVTAYLSANGYSDFTVEDTDAGFSVLAKSAESFVGEIKTIKADTGVTFHVGTLAINQEGLEMTKEAKSATAETKSYFKLGELTAEQVTQKYDCWLASLSRGTTLAQVLTDANEGSFIGAWELNDAFWAALNNLVEAGDLAGIKALTAEYGDMIVRILTALNAAGAQTAEFKEAFMAEKKVEGSAKTDTSEDVTLATPVAEVVADNAAPAEDAHATQEPVAEETAKAADIASIIAKAVQDAVSPLKGSVEALASQVADIQKGTSESLADLTQKVSKADERVDTLETARQTRKSSDDEGLNSSTQVTKTEADSQREERLLRNALGFANRA